MEEKSSARFSEYLFAKMGGQDVSASQGPRKVTADTRKWMRENLLLMVTLSGVLFGVILGEWRVLLLLITLKRFEAIPILKRLLDFARENRFLRIISLKSF